MPRKPIDLGAVRSAEAKLDQLVATHPELTHNAERQQALADWLKSTVGEETDDAPSENREASRTAPTV